MLLPPCGEEGEDEHQDEMMQILQRWKACTNAVRVLVSTRTGFISLEACLLRVPYPAALMAPQILGFRARLPDLEGGGWVAWLIQRGLFRAPRFNGFWQCEQSTAGGRVSFHSRSCEVSLCTPQAELGNPTARLLVGVELE